MQQPDETWIDATGSESQDHIALYDVRPGKRPNHLYRVALERLGGRQFVEQLELPEDSQLKIHALRRWHKDKLGPVQRIASYMLCKQFYIGISQLKSTPAQLESAYHETYSHLLFRNELLTRAFRQPSSLAEDGIYSQQLEAARVGPEHRRVVLIGQ